ncbi:hypothetical protein MPLA_570024 [Mesorhizobium sp. ORS 3359]|nr:hypothetical protein MPLA_570024 [Mesorhizobium sp. ORS 3359]
MAIVALDRRPFMGSEVSDRVARLMPGENDGSDVTSAVGAHNGCVAFKSRHAIDRFAC